MLKNTKNRTIHNVIIIILLLLLFFNAIQLYHVNRQVNINNRYKKDIITLMLLDKDIDTIFLRQMGHFNYDQTNINLSRFNSIFSNFRRDRELYPFFQNNKAYNSYIALQRKFEDKSRLARRFASEDTILASSTKQLINLFREIRFSYRFENTNKAYFIHSLILQASLGQKTNLDAILKDLRSFKKEIASKPDTLLNSYFKRAEYVIHYMQSIQSLTKKNQAIDLMKHINNFRLQFEKYADGIVNSLYTNLSLLIVLIVFFILAISYLVRKIDQKTQKLFQFQQAVQNSDNTVVITDPNHKINYVNSAFEKTTGYTMAEAIGQTPAILQSGLHDRSFYDEMKIKLQNKENWIGEFSNRRKDGNIIYEKASIYPMLDKKSNLEGYLAIKLDITSEKAYLQEIEQKNMEILARYQIDDETGLWSKNVLIDELAKKTTGYIIYIKLEDFSDTRFFYGTSTANLIMQKAALRLKQFISAYKIEGQPFRIGEDDFCIWYRHKRPPSDLFLALDDYFKSFPVEVDQTIHTIRLLIGISSDKDLPQGDRLLQGMIAYYKAKKYGNLYVYYVENNELEKEYRHNILTTQKIRYALENDLVSVQCQPIFNTQTKEVFSYEILMRLHDKDGTIMYPGEFLEISKHASLYTPLMFRVISLTFELLENYPELKFSINMSVIDMLDKKTVDLFVKCLESCKNPKNLIVEILESEGIENYDGITPFLSKVRSYGCKLSIDDFGSGYSNYYRIMQLDIDHIKIDGSIIKELPYDPSSRIVVETILEFAKRKQWEVVAEFVSSEEIYKIVKEYGIPFTQGFYLGKPEKIDSHKQT